MSRLNKFLSRMWDPRPMLAREWLESAEKYEERLKGNPAVSPLIIEAVLQERNRIHALFKELLPEFAGRISVVVTTDVQTENCSVFLWNERLYVLVSGALIGRPYDHPQDPGLKGWEWLARHEAAHVRGGDLWWLFHVRRLFRVPFKLCMVQWVLLSLFASKETLSAWLGPALGFLAGLWFIQTVVCLVLEWRADLAATRSMKDPLILDEAEKSLYRMTAQARKRLPSILGWIQYGISLLFFDPHPPLLARRWLMRRKRRALENL